MKLLILGTAIMAADPEENTDDFRVYLLSGRCDQIIPKHVIAGYLLVDTTVPGDFTPGTYTWDGAAVVKIPPIVPPVVVPEQVTMRQARLALLGADMLTQVNAAVAAMPSPAGDAARIEWEFSSEVQRHRQLVAALGGILGLTDAQLDQLFITASKL